VADALVFAYDNVGSAAEIAEALRGSLTDCEPTTSFATRAARLYVVSDVLRNSGQPIRGAQQYRAFLQPALPKIFAALSLALRASSSRLAAATFEERVLRVLEAWLRWSLFPPVFVYGLESTFFDDAAIAWRVTDDEPDDDALRRRARQAGVPDEDHLSLRLAKASAYSAFRAQGNDPRASLKLLAAHAEKQKHALVVSETSQKQQDAHHQPVSMDDDDDDEDIDGEPMDDDDDEPVVITTTQQQPPPENNSRRRRDDDDLKARPRSSLLLNNNPRYRSRSRSPPRGGWGPPHHRRRS